MPWKCNFCSCFKPEVEDIRDLDYNHHSLKEVPSDVFAHERTLEELSLEANRIKDLPRALFHCHGLRVLNLSDNDIKTMPPAIASLINLQHLNLSKNSLSDIPDNIKCCKQLAYINVSVNPLEKLPEGFTQLIALEELYLNDTFLEFLPANFGRLSKLRVLDLRENNLNTLPKSIARLSNLQVLDIGRNEFSDLPEVIGSLPELRDLWVDYNKIRCIPQFIGNLQNLRNIDISNNNVQWIAPEIEDCIHLNFLVVSGNELQHIPEEIGNLKELTMLKLDDNDLESLPSTIGKLSNLEELVLSQNVIELLPPTIGLLRKVEIINADDNRLSELPSELCSCTSLRILSVRNNMLDLMPAEIGHLSGIRVINVADNLLHNLPVSILNLSQLTALWLSTNQTTPLTTLQKEVDPRTGQTVCVNFMFPQVEQERNISQNAEDRLEGEPVSVERPSRPHIRFADSTELRHPSRLTRAPTPYPKELRSMAKHARILVTRPLQPQPDAEQEHMPLMGEMSSSSDARNVTIKTATVKKPVTALMMESEFNSGPHRNMKAEDDDLDSLSSSSEQAHESYREDHVAMAEDPDLPHVEQYNTNLTPLSTASYADRPRYDFATTNEKLYEETSRMLPPLHHEQTALLIKSNSKEHLSGSVGNGGMDIAIELINQENMFVEEGLSMTNITLEEDCHINIEMKPNGMPEPIAAKQPPPYHIAAVYSKQAAYFMNAPAGNGFNTTPFTGGTDGNVSSPTPKMPFVKDISGDVVPVQTQVDSTVQKQTETLVEALGTTEPEVVDIPTAVDTPTKALDMSLDSEPSLAGSKCRIPVSKPKDVSGLPKPHDASPDKTSIPSPPSKLPAKSVSKIPSFTSKDRSPLANKLPAAAATRMLQPGFHVSSHIPRPGSIAPPSLENDNAVTSVDSNLNQCSVPDMNNSNSSSNSNGVESSAVTTPSFKSRIPSLIPSPGKNTPTSPASPTSPTWVFGQHKNPTVFPVMIVKNPGLGFSIGGGAGASAFTDKADYGIFITKVHPGGPASGSLVAGDKILEVDGIDFAKLEHDQAVGILKQTKNVVNMMISRQK